MRNSDFLIRCGMRPLPSLRRGGKSAPSSILHPPSSILHPPSSILHPPSSILHPPSSILYPLSSILYPPSSILHLLSSVSFTTIADAGASSDGAWRGAVPKGARRRRGCR